MPPDLTSASRRAQLRQDRYAPLRGGLRPVLTQSPRDANTTRMGRDEKRGFKPNKKHFWLANISAIKERENGGSANQKTAWHRC
jgi:hypothetical protein